MQATLSLHSTMFVSGSPKTKTPVSPAARSIAADEITAYLGVRDQLLRAAEEATTDANLHLAWMANQFAEECLRPARAPYQAQSLPEGEAIPERQRCKAVKTRIAELRANVGLHHLAECRAA